MDHFTLAARTQPDVLEARWQVCINLDQWPVALVAGKAFKAQAPDRPEGYIYTGSTLKELGRREEAFQMLAQAAQKFPQDEIIV